MLEAKQGWVSLTDVAEGLRDKGTRPSDLAGDLPAMEGDGLIETLDPPNLASLILAEDLDGLKKNTMCRVLPEGRKWLTRWAFLSR